MALGGTFFVASYFLLGASRVFPLFLFAIAVFTAGEVTFTILQSVFLASQTPSSHRGRVTAIVQLIAGAGWSIGPLVTGSIADATSASFTWNVVGAVMIVAVVGILLLKKLEKPAEPGPAAVDADGDGGAAE
jgi:MFS family permease